MKLFKKIIIITFLLLIYIYVCNVCLLPSSYIIMQGENLNLYTLLGLSIKENLDYQTLQTSSTIEQTQINKIGKVNFSLNLFNIDYLLLTTLAFIVFCFTSSIVYILNDISDIEKDRLHPVKKFRPLASGEISKKQAYAIIAILAAIIAVIMLFFFNKTNNIFAGGKNIRSI